MTSPPAATPSVAPLSVASPAARPSAAVSPLASPSVAPSRFAAPQAQPMMRPPEEPRMPQRRGGSKWQNILGLALATAADAMAARAGRRGQSVSGLRQQIAGREDRDRERSEREVLRQYRNKTKQFEFEQEGVRRRLAKEERAEIRGERRTEKETEFQRLVSMLPKEDRERIAGAQGLTGGTVTGWRRELGEAKNREDLKKNLEDPTVSVADLTKPGWSQKMDDILAKAEELGMSVEETKAQLQVAIYKKRLAEKEQEGYWKQRIPEGLGIP